MPHPSFKDFFRRYWLSLLLSIICVLVLWSAVASAVQLYRSGNLRLATRHSRAQAGPVAIAEIQPWMTFDYLNRVFRQPPDYLKIGLNIQSTAYPHLQIGRYARSRHLDTAVFLNSVREAIRSRGER